MAGGGWACAQTSTRRRRPWTLPLIPRHIKGEACTCPPQTPFVTGANRGLGRHLVDQLLDRGVAKVYALARDPSTIAQDERVVRSRVPIYSTSNASPTPHAEGPTQPSSSTRVHRGVRRPARVRARRRAARDGSQLRRHVRAIRAFVPVLEANRGRIANILSLLSLASTPPMTGYSASKAAAHSLAQALRPVLAERGITVHGVYPAGIDTDMLAGMDLPKTPPADVARGVSTASKPTRRTSSPTPTPGPCPKSGGTTRSRSSGRSPARLRLSRAEHLGRWRGTGLSHLPLAPRVTTWIDTRTGPGLAVTRACERCIA